ncbi:hypothetical protein CPB85DRAFT_481102 [Mucidula mucida]|nr:hypothetical protein CPB85DRAFT_481102 [Mucidula mucida]
MTSSATDRLVPRRAASRLFDGSGLSTRIRSVAIPEVHVSISHELIVRKVSSQQTSINSELIGSFNDLQVPSSGRIPQFLEGKERKPGSSRRIFLGFFGALAASGVGLYLAKEVMNRRRRVELEIYRNLQKEQQRQQEAQARIAPSGSVSTSTV